MIKNDMRHRMPLEMALNFPPVRKIFLSHIPDFDKSSFYSTLPDLFSLQDLIDHGLISLEQGFSLLQDLVKFDAQFKKMMEQEAAEFGVPFDLDDPKHQWSATDTAIREACVSRIEEIYRGRAGEIIFYGPSNIQMWYSLEQDMLPYKAQNHGMGGCVDSDMIQYAPRMLYAFKPSVVFFQTGSNDLASGLSLDTILENKKNMYQLFLEHMPDTKLVVMAGLPLPGRTRYWDDTVRTNLLLKELCEHTDLMFFMDATDALLSGNGSEVHRTSDGRYFSPQYYRSDGIHLNKAGHDIWTRHMKQILKQIL